MSPVAPAHQRLPEVPFCMLGQVGREKLETPGNFSASLGHGALFGSICETSVLSKRGVDE